MNLLTYIPMVIVLVVYGLLPESMASLRHRDIDEYHRRRREKLKNKRMKS